MQLSCKRRRAVSRPVADTLPEASSPVQEHCRLPAGSLQLAVRRSPPKPDIQVPP